MRESEDPAPASEQELTLNSGSPVPGLRVGERGSRPCTLPGTHRLVLSRRVSVPGAWANPHPGVQLSRYQAGPGPACSQRTPVDLQDGPSFQNQRGPGLSCWCPERAKQGLPCWAKVLLLRNTPVVVPGEGQAGAPSWAKVVLLEGRPLSIPGSCSDSWRDQPVAPRWAPALISAPLCALARECAPRWLLMWYLEMNKQVP